MPRLDYLFPSFSGGLADGLASDTAPPGALKVCDNADFSKAPMGGVTGRPAVRMVESPTGNFRGIWLVRFQDYKNSNWPYVMIGRNQAIPIGRYLDSFHPAIDLSVSLQSRHAIPDEDKIFFVGGIYPAVMELNPNSNDDAPYSTRRMGHHEVNVAQVDGGSVDVGVHHYIILMTDAASRKRMVQEPWVITVTSTTDRVEFGNLPVKGTKYVYRTLANADENELVYYLVITVNDGATTYNDTVADSTITDNEILDPSLYSVPPEDLADMVIHNGRGWGFTENSSVLRYTAQFDYENWPEINSIPIGDPDAITALASVGDMLLVFKANRCYGFWGNDIATFDYRPLSATYGTTFVKTIKVLDSNTVVFLDSQKRVIMFRGGSFAEVSKTIRMPQSHRYWSSLYRDYYILWSYGSGQPSRDMIIEPIDDIQTFPRRGPYFRMDDPEHEPGGPFEPPVEPPGEGDPDVPPGGGGGGESDDLFDDAIWGEWPGGVFNPGDPNIPDLPDDDHRIGYGGGERPDYQRQVIGYCLHIPSSVWTRWTGIKASLPEIPDRPQENLVFWDGYSFGVIGLSAAPSLLDFGDFEVRTTDSDCGYPNQQKSFKEIEIYFEHIDRYSFDGTVGQLEVIVDDGSNASSVIQQEIIYNSLNPLKRQKFRIRNGANGTRISARFVGMNEMWRFSLLQVRVWFEPRGTAIR